MQTGASLGRPPPAPSPHAYGDAAARGLHPLHMPVLQPASPSASLPQAPGAGGAGDRDGAGGTAADTHGANAVDHGEGGGGWSDGDDGGGGGGGWSDADDGYDDGGGGGWSDAEQEPPPEAGVADPDPDPGSDKDKDQENCAVQGNRGGPQSRAAAATSEGTSQRAGRSSPWDAGPRGAAGGTHGGHGGTTGVTSDGAQASAPDAAAAAPLAAKEGPAKRRLKRSAAQRNSLTGAVQTSGQGRQTVCAQNEWRQSTVPCTAAVWHSEHGM